MRVGGRWLKRQRLDGKACKHGERDAMSIDTQDSQWARIELRSKIDALLFDIRCLHCLTPTTQRLQSIALLHATVDALTLQLAELGTSRSNHHS